MKNSVYLLQHSSEIDGCIETKVLGIFSTYEKANSQILKYKELKGFKNYQDDFYIDQYPLDNAFWIKGFEKKVIDLQKE